MTANKVTALQQLRLQMQEVNPGVFCIIQFDVHFMDSVLLVMQARNFAFLESFMPTFAKKQMVCYTFDVSIHN